MMTFEVAGAFLPTSQARPCGSLSCQYMGETRLVVPAVLVRLVVSGVFVAVVVVVVVVVLVSSACT